MWFLGFLLFLRDLFNWSSSSNLFSWFFVFFSNKFVVNVTNISSSSTLLSWSVNSSSTTSSVKSVTLRNTLNWFSITVSVMSDLFSIVSNSGWDLSVDSFWSFSGLISSEFFQLSSFLVSWNKIKGYFFWLL